MGQIIDVGASGGPSSAVETVTTFGALPLPPAEGIGAERVTADTGVLYIWDGAVWNAVAGGGSIVGGTNVGTGTGLVFKDVSGANLRFRSVAVDASIGLTAGVDTISLAVASAPNVTGVVAIANGGTGQSNQQAALNNITNIAGGSDGDVLKLSAGNAQWATPPATGVTSFNTRTGAVTLTASDVNTALGLGASNAFLFTDGTQSLITYSNWSIDPVTLTSNVFNTIQPNNLGNSPTSFGWATNVAPLQDSPNDSMSLQNFNVNLDSGATGFNFGGNGQAGQIITGGYNYGGNGATFGTLRNINLNASLGNGIDPGTFKGYTAVANSLEAAANITLDGQFQGYDYNLNINAGAITTSNFTVLWMSDFSQMPVDVYGYQALTCQTGIATIKNNKNFTGVFINPTVNLFEGNSGYFAFQAGGTVTTAGTGGVQGFAFNTNITTVPATSNITAIACFNQIAIMAATSQFHGVNISPTITTLDGSFDAYQSTPQIAGGSGQVQLFSGGMGSVTTSGNTSVMNLNGLTADGKQSQFAADNVHMNIGGTLVPISSAPGGIQIQHVLFTSLAMSGVGAITGTDVLCNVLSPDVDFGTITDSIALGPTGLGIGMVGFAGQLHGHGQMDLLSAVIPTGIFSNDFTLGEWRNVNAYIINAGYTGACAKATAFYHEVAGAGLFATDHWGLKVVTTGIQNYVESMAFGTGTQKVTNASVAIELGGNSRAFVNLNVTTIEKLALTALPGMQVFDTTLNQLSYYNGTVWVNI